MRPRLAYPVAILTGALLTLAFPEPSLSFLAWIALAPVLYLTTGAGGRRGALVWAAFGFGFLGTLLSWISIAGWVAWGVLLVVEIPFIAAFGALWGKLSDKTGSLGRIALAGGAWAAFEYARSVFPVGGFTWGQLAQSQHDLQWMLEWAELAGGVVLAGVLVAVNAALAELFRARREAKRFIVPVVVIVIAFGVPLTSSLFTVTSSTARPFTVAVVQGNADPLVPETLEKQAQILRNHVHLTEELSAKVDLVVWPESAVSLDPDSPGVLELLEQAATAVDAPMLVGGNEELEEDDRYQVGTFLISPEGEIVDRYHKTHLVPFGEYVPGRRYLDWLPILDQIPRDAVPGDEGKLFSVGDLDVATVISYEGDFGSLVRARVATGGDVVVVATNTSTWLHSWASAQHVAFSQVRAAENATPVIHAAISGISAVIDARGEVLETLPLYEGRTMVRTISPRSHTTPYTRLGDWILLGFVVTCALAWWLGRGSQKVASPDA